MPNGLDRGQGMGLGRGKGNLQRCGLGGTNICRCSKCGHTQVYARGMPCSQLACPQ